VLASTEITKLKRDIATLSEAVGIGLKPGSKSPLGPSDRRALKSDIQACMQALDELSTRLSG